MRLCFLLFHLVLLSARLVSTSPQQLTAKKSDDHRTLSRRAGSDTQWGPWPDRTIPYCFDVINGGPAGWVQNSFPSGVDLRVAFRLAISKWTDAEGFDIQFKEQDLSCRTYADQGGDMTKTLVVSEVPGFPWATPGFKDGQLHVLYIDPQYRFGSWYSSDGELQRGGSLEDWSRLLARQIGWVLCLQDQHHARDAQNYLSWNWPSLKVYQNIRLGHNTDVTKAEVDEATDNIEAAVQLAVEKGVYGPIHFLQHTTRPTLIDRFDPDSIMLPGSEFSSGRHEVIQWREDWKAYIDNTDYPVVRIALDRPGPSASDLEMVKLLWSEGDEEDLQQEAEEAEEEDEEDWDDCSTVVGDPDDAPVPPNREELIEEGERLIAAGLNMMSIADGSGYQPI